MEPICPNCGGVLILQQQREETFMLNEITPNRVHLRYIRTSQPVDSGTIKCLKCSYAWAHTPEGLKILMEEMKDEDRVHQPQH